MNIAPEIFWNVKSEKLVKRFNPQDVANIYLVATGKKPAGLGEYRARHHLETVQETLEDVGLCTTIVTSEDKVRAWGPEERMNDLLFWGGPKKMEPMIREFYLQGDLGSFLGYPDCCRKTFRSRTRFATQYHQELKAAYEKNGLTGIEPYAGIQHIPCKINCEQTLALGYAEAIKPAPQIYGAAITDLLHRVQAAILEAPR